MNEGLHLNQQDDLSALREKTPSLEALKASLFTALDGNRRTFGDHSSDRRNFMKDTGRVELVTRPESTVLTWAAVEALPTVLDQTEHLASGLTEDEVEKASQTAVQIIANPTEGRRFLFGFSEKVQQFIYAVAAALVCILLLSNPAMAAAAEQNVAIAIAQDDEEVAPTKTPVATPTKTPTKTPTSVTQKPVATATPDANKPVETATPIPVETKEIQVVKIAKGINLRKGPGKKYDITKLTEDEMSLEFTGKVLTNPDDGLTWYEVINPEYNSDDEKSQEKIYVAQVPGVTLATEIIENAVGGNVVTEAEMAAQELAEVSQILGTPVTNIDKTLNAWRALSGNTIVGVLDRGVWKPVEQVGTIENSDGEKYLWERVPANLQEVLKKYPYDSNIGGWHIEGTKYYFPIDTSKGAEVPTLEDGIVDINKGFTITNPDNIITVKFMPGPGAVIDTSEWKGDGEKVKRLTSIIQEFLQLQNGQRFEVVLLKDITSRDSFILDPNGKNYFSGGRNYIDKQITQIDTELSGQVMAFPDSQGNTIVRVYISMTDKTFTETPQNVLGSRATFSGLHDAMITARLAFFEKQDKGTYQDYYIGPIGQGVGDKLVALYDKQADGSYVSPFGGTPSNQ